MTYKEIVQPPEVLNDGSVCRSLPHRNRANERIKTEYSFFVRYTSAGNVSQLHSCDHILRRQSYYIFIMTMNIFLLRAVPVCIYNNVLLLTLFIFFIHRQQEARNWPDYYFG